ncbi:MAG: peptide-methionine (S)-S-oxide reductase MsrA [Anaerocolumna sp.]
MLKENDSDKVIYLAGGCFWGTEKYLSGIKGILKTDVGYANGNTEFPTYGEVCNNNTGHAETVRVVYDPEVVSLSFILTLYYDVINPTSVNKQGADNGTQYRTGIYYIDDKDIEIIKKSLAGLQKKHDKPIAVEVLPLNNYYLAENYHQKYLNKNPNGYCHIGTDKFEKAKSAIDTNSYGIN